MSSLDRLPARASFGSKAIGRRRVVAINGCGDTGSVLHSKGPIGAIRITTTIAKVSNSTKDIGTGRTTTTATGRIMIAGEGTEIMMTESMSITIRR